MVDGPDQRGPGGEKMIYFFTNIPSLIRPLNFFVIVLFLVLNFDLGKCRLNIRIM